jgi:hypothetical protein
MAILLTDEETSETVVDYDKSLRIRAGMHLITPRGALPLQNTKDAPSSASSSLSSSSSPPPPFSSSVFKEEKRDPNIGVFSAALACYP